MITVPFFSRPVENIVSHAQATTSSDVLVLKHCGCLRMYAHTPTAIRAMWRWKFAGRSAGLTERCTVLTTCFSSANVSSLPVRFLSDLDFFSHDLRARRICTSRVLCFTGPSNTHSMMSWHLDVRKDALRVHGRRLRLAVRRYALQWLQFLPSASNNGVAVRSPGCT